MITLLNYTKLDERHRDVDIEQLKITVIVSHKRHEHILSNLSAGLSGNGLVNIGRAPELVIVFCFSDDHGIFANA